jgi:hypothetical protein
LCGDSQRKSNKARGYLYEKDNRYIFHCHNCAVSISFENLLKQLDYRLYFEYGREKLTNRRVDPDDIWRDDKPIQFQTDDFALSELKKLKTISQLPVEHPAKKYIVERKIPTQYHALFRWCPNFMTWTNTIKPEQFKENVLCYDEGRILIPYFNKAGTFFAYQGRILHNHATRYIYIILDYDVPRVFGLNTVDITENIFVFEGPIDSCFIPNSLAAGSHLSELIKISTLDKFTICYDNEPHSIETKKKITKAIDHGFRVCIWPSSIVEKDINEMVLKRFIGYPIDYLKYVIETNTFSGMMAKAKLAAWSKT